MATPNDDQVRFDILIEAKAALQAMRDLFSLTTDNNQKIIQFTQTVVAQSKLWGISWQQALGVYRLLNAEITKMGGVPLFGGSKNQTENLLNLSEHYLKAADGAKRLGEASTDAGNKTESATKRMVRGLDLVRIAAGALVAMLIFNVINAIQMAFSQAINLAKQYEDTLYRLRNVEQSLSMQGIEISMKGLKKGIEDIQKLLPIFSKEDVSQLVGTLAISTKQLGLNEQQILDLAKAIGILNIRSEKQEELSVTAQHVLSSLLTGNAKGITSLGIAFTDNVMRAKAMELGFLEVGEALSTLTENEKGLTKLNIVLDSTSTELGNVGEYLDSNSAKLQMNKASWNDLLTTVGQLLLPMIPVATGFFQLINDGFNVVKVGAIELITVIATLGTTLAMLFTGQIANPEQLFTVLSNSMTRFREALVNNFFQEMPENAPKWFRDRWGQLIKEEAETATSGINEFGEAVEDFDASGFESEIEKILEDLARAREDLDRKLGQKREDIEIEYQRKRADAERDYLRTVEDINRDAERDLARLREEHRQEDERAEAEYQLRLWELRMRYLMDLEDALHARDARQVIRLQKQYEIDKEALRRRHELEQNEREQSQQNEVEDIELRRQQRLEDARIEYEQKLADQRLAKQRELDDLNVWYAREQADLELATQRKLETLINGWIEEQKITEANAAEVYGILRKYFGPGGMTDALYQYMMQSLLQVSANAAVVAGQMAALNSLNSFSGIVGQVGTSEGATETGVSTNVPNMNTGSVGGRNVTPKSGLLTTPTLGALVPTNLAPTRLGQTSRGSVNGSQFSRDALNGAIMLELALSPDLEARVVEKSMNGVADVIVKVTDSK